MCLLAGYIAAVLVWVFLFVFFKKVKKIDVPESALNKTHVYMYNILSYLVFIYLLDHGMCSNSSGRILRHSQDSQET